MPPPSRTRRILKWTGAALSLLFLAIWIWSLPYNTILRFGSSTTFQVSTGVFYFAYDSQLISAPARWSVRPNNLAGFDNWFAFGFRVPGYRWPAGSFFEMLVPLWCFFLACAIPTAWLWHRDRRRVRPGCCRRCGYNLTGNTSGDCSECGAPTPPTHAPRPPASV